MQRAPADRFHFDAEDVDTLWQQLKDHTTIVDPIDPRDSRIEDLSPVSPDQEN
ncbi:MAG TPA: hypothetical protein VIX19_04330 [Terriglobales bacterium]